MSVQTKSTFSVQTSSSKTKCFENMGLSQCSIKLGPWITFIKNISLKKTFREQQNFTKLVNLDLYELQFVEKTSIPCSEKECFSFCRVKSLNDEKDTCYSFSLNMECWTFVQA